MEPKILVVYLDIGNEDGPSFSTYLADFYKYNDSIPPSHIKVVNINWIRWDMKYITDEFLSIFHKYHIANIVEIHDWYDFISDTDINMAQITKTPYLNNSISYNNESLIFVTVIPYNVTPIKYLIPYSNETYQSILEYKQTLESDDNMNSKRMIREYLRPYIIDASYYDIMVTYGNRIVNHTVMLSDEIEDPIF